MNSQHLADTISAACLRMPPAWPLDRFVAVNPLLGLLDRPFGATAAWLREAGAGELLPAPPGQPQPATTAGPRRQTLTAWAQARLGGTWNTTAVEEISKWCAAELATDGPPEAVVATADQLWGRWREDARVDRNPEFLGWRHFRHQAAAWPAAAEQMIADTLDVLAVPPAARLDYLYLQLSSVAGWAGHLQWRAGTAEAKQAPLLPGLLAIRLAFERALHHQCRTEPTLADWHSAWASTVSEGTPLQADLRAREAALLARETAYQEPLLERLRECGAPRAATPARPALQAVFCIDVRSERLRRALEACSGEIQTLGFAGFFGLPLARMPADAAGPAVPRCPVLLQPSFRLREGAPEGCNAPPVRRPWMSRVAKAWQTAQNSAAGAFSLVETTGLACAVPLLAGCLGWSPAPRSALPPPILEHDPATETGLPLPEQVRLAAGILRNLGLTGGPIAPVVLFCGHGSTTVNNLHGAGYHCGACGGQPGDFSARVAAALLNSPTVRQALASQGLPIPADTRFLAGLHDTVTDEINLFETADWPAERGPELAQLTAWLAAASAACRRERAPLLDLPPGPDAALLRRLRARSRDWSEVRPEWGLAGNAAFIAAPRARTRGLDLAGRTFLHDYDPAKDTDGSVLELILTAPLVVASWINLQYYASRVDPIRFGAGSKTLHNLVGDFAVGEGNGGDLRGGLPWQALHDGTHWRHEPLRLSVFITAAPAAIDRVLAAHTQVRQLVENGYLHLFALAVDSPAAWRCNRLNSWLTL